MPDNEMKWSLTGKQGMWDNPKPATVKAFVNGVEVWISALEGEGVQLWIKDLASGESRFLTIAEKR